MYQMNAKLFFWNLYRYMYLKPNNWTNLGDAWRWKLKHAISFSFDLCLCNCRENVIEFGRNRIKGVKQFSSSSFHPVTNPLLWIFHCVRLSGNVRVEKSGMPVLWEKLPICNLCYQLFARFTYIELRLRLTFWWSGYTIRRK